MSLARVTKSPSILGKRHCRINHRLKAGVIHKALFART
jgi:hypothetical protein